MMPTYDLKKIKFAIGEATFKRAMGLYESGKVTEIEQLGGYYSAVVRGTKPYRVSISAKNFKYFPVSVSPFPISMMNPIAKSEFIC